MILVTKASNVLASTSIPTTLNVKHMDFADLQGGKGPCNRKAATIKSHMKICHDEGNNIESASNIKVAILSSGGVPAVNVAVSGPLMIQNSIKLRSKV